MGRSLAAMVYSTLANIIFVFLYGHVPGDVVLHFLRNAFIIPLLLVTLGLVSGKYHVIIFGMFYYLFLVFFSFHANNSYLQHNLVFFFIIVAGTVAGLYIFLSNFADSAKRNKQIVRQSHDLKALILKEKEQFAVKIGMKDQIVEIITKQVKSSLDEVRTYLEFLVKNHEELNVEVRKRYAEVLLEAVNSSSEIILSIQKLNEQSLDDRKQKPGWIALNEIFESVALSLKEMGAKKGVEIIYTPTDARVFADYYTLLAVVIKLVEIATCFSRGGKKIHMMVTTAHPDIVLQITGKAHQKPIKRFQEVWEQIRTESEWFSEEFLKEALNLEFSRNVIGRQKGNLELDLGEEFKFIISFPGKQN